MAIIETLYSQYKSITTENVEKFQLQYGISDIQLSKAIGIDRAAISRWKAGVKPLSDTTLTALYFVMKEFDNLSH